MGELSRSAPDQDRLSAKATSHARSNKSNLTADASNSRGLTSSMRLVLVGTEEPRPTPPLFSPSSDGELSLVPRGAPASRLRADERGTPTAGAS